MYMKYKRDAMTLSCNVLVLHNQDTSTYPGLEHIHMYCEMLLF